jgi:hypothetical protein
VVAKVVFILLADRSQGGACHTSCGRNTGDRLLAHGVEELLGARCASQYAVHTRHEAFVLVHDAIRRGAVAMCALLAVAQVVVVGRIIVVASLAPDPGGEPGGRDGDGED